MQAWLAPITSAAPPTYCYPQPEPWPAVVKEDADVVDPTHLPHAANGSPPATPAEPYWMPQPAPVSNYPQFQSEAAPDALGPYPYLPLCHTLLPADECAGGLGPTTPPKLPTLPGAHSFNTTAARQQPECQPAIPFDQVLMELPAGQDYWQPFMHAMC